MFNLLIQKTKRIIEMKIFENEVISNKNTIPKYYLDMETDDVELKGTIYDIIKTIKDPEKPATLEALNVVQEDDVHVSKMPSNNIRLIRVEFTPTVPHCSLATLIGLCIRVKLQRILTEKFKIDIYVKEGTHSTEEDINKQVNDKERVAAAMENANLFKIVEQCIKENDL